MSRFNLLKKLFFNKLDGQEPANFTIVHSVRVGVDPIDSDSG